MFLDRIDNRKQQEQAYREQLKDQISHKQSRIKMKDGSAYHPENQAFSLITNIEREQQERKKKNTDYYDQLKQQIEEQRNLKKRMEQEKKRKQYEEDQKIREDQLRLQQRYQDEKRRQEGKGKDKASKPDLGRAPDLPELGRKKIYTTEQKPIEKRSSQQQWSDVGKSRDKIYSLQTPLKQSGLNFNPNSQDVSVHPSLYPNKIENETFNYISRNSYKSNYYQQLLGQRRKLQEETNQIAELNRVFNFEKYRRKEQSRGIQQLRNLHKMLDQKNSEYIGLEFRPAKASHNSGNLLPVGKTRVVSHSQKMNKDEWKKLD